MRECVSQKYFLKHEKFFRRAKMELISNMIISDENCHICYTDSMDTVLEPCGHGFFFHLQRISGFKWLISTKSNNEEQSIKCIYKDWFFFASYFFSAICFHCSNQIRQCPLCRVDISGRVRIAKKQSVISLERSFTYLMGMNSNEPISTMV